MSSLKNINWEELLKKVQNPGRYTGSEYNRYEKKKFKFGFLLAFPDDYKIGMSSLGYHTIGEIVNQSPNFYVQRAFAPAEDMERLMREKDIPLFSLESKAPASEFDIIGFSFHYELAYTNYVNMMELSGLSPFRKDRKENNPIIIGDGPVTVNPEILSQFMDIVMVGEAESVLPLILDKYEKGKRRSKFLKELSNLAGVYIPGLSQSVKKAVFEEFSTGYHPYRQPVPVVDVVHNRLNIEINRGCRNRCWFCQAANIYAPYRQRSSSDINDLAVKSVASTGFDEISLTALSASCHPELSEILDELYFSLRDLGVSVVLSSMRPEAFKGKVAGRLGRFKSGGLTLAPETPSERLKKVIGKNIKNSDIIRIASKAKKMGWKKIKLYFMVGLPGEKDKDIEEIVDFIKEVKIKSRVNINVSVNPLIPQAHTPFQWVKGIDPDELFEKIEYISSKAPARVNNFCKEKYIVESILTRGGQKLRRDSSSGGKRRCSPSTGKEVF